jgi:3-deoxy-D-manno-octulosonic-acid transferase
MNLILVSLIVIIIETLLLPVAVAACLVVPKLKSTLPERLGWGEWPNISCAGGSRIVWLHAASVGEVTGITPVIKGLRKDNPGSRFLFTTTSTTGKAEVRKRFPEDCCALLPFDHPFFLARAFLRVRPSLLVIAETELWPSLLFCAFFLKIPVVSFNARISDFSFGRYRLFRFLLAPYLERFEHIFVQSEDDKQRFLALGARKEAVTVCGSTKYDQIRPEVGHEKLQIMHKEFDLNPAWPCFVAGSVRMGEEDIVLDAYKKAIEKFPGLSLIMAPRQVERFDEMAGKVQSAGFEIHRRSEGVNTTGCRVVILDTVGELSSVYALATVCFVGGGFTPVGGHNPLEPAALGKPVLFGPGMNNFRDCVSQMIARGGGQTVSDADELGAAIIALLDDPARAAAMGKAARSVWQGYLGATQVVVADISDRLGGGA